MADKRTNIIFRFGIVYLLIVIAFVAVVAKIVIIQTTERDSWLTLHERSAIRSTRVEPATRGNIYARDGRLMASSIPTYRVFMDMRTPALHRDDLFLTRVDSVSVALAALFRDRTAREYRNDLLRAFNERNSRFPIFPRRISHSQWKELQTFPLFNLGSNRSGLISEKFIRREKPFGTLASRTIGDVFADQTQGGGRVGLERHYDAELTGRAGLSRRRKIANRWQDVVEVQPVDGMDIITTIDIDIQDIAENALLDVLRQHNAHSGYAVVMETKTGEIKAIVNKFRGASGRFYERQNGAVSDMLEPGSTFKTMVMMALLDDGNIKPDDIINTGNGRIRHAGRDITDHNERAGGFGNITAAQVLHGSSNIGMHKMVHATYGTNQGAMVDKLRAMGFTTEIELEIPGTGRPIIGHPQEAGSWSATSLSALSRGYEISIPPIYVLMHYNAIANNGRMVKPMFVRSINRDGRVVRSFSTTTVNRSIAKPSTIRAIHEMLLGVVECELGTANRQRSDMVRIAGKTGTARVWCNTNKRYLENRHRVSFCGYFPADNPQYTAIVVVNEPVNTHAGRASSVVAFRNIAERIMALQSVNPQEFALADSVRMRDMVVLPRSSNGNKAALHRVMNDVTTRRNRFPISGESSEWVRINIVDGEKRIQPLELADGIIPDVRGMGAKDAVYLLEKLGLNVQINGRGRIVSQSINPGTQATRGRAIVLN